MPQRRNTNVKKQFNFCDNAVFISEGEDRCQRHQSRQCCLPELTVFEIQPALKLK